MSIRILILFFSITLFGCSSIDMKDIEARPDGLTYYRNTGRLVDGDVIRKFENGNIAERVSYEKGKQIGKWSTYDYQGNDFTHGYIVLLDKAIISENKNISLSNATLSMNSEEDYKYASLGIPDNSAEPNISELLNLRNMIFQKYKDVHQFKDVHIFHKDNQYRFEKLTYSEPIICDTVKTNDGLIINFR